MNTYNSHGAGRGWCHSSRHGRGVLYSVKVDAWIGLLRVGAKFVWIAPANGCTSIRLLRFNPPTLFLCFLARNQESVERLVWEKHAPCARYVNIFSTRARVCKKALGRARRRLHDRGAECTIISRTALPSRWETFDQRGFWMLGQVTVWILHS